MLSPCQRSAAPRRRDRMIVRLSTITHQVGSQIGPRLLKVAVPRGRCCLVRNMSQTTAQATPAVSTGAANCMTASCPPQLRSGTATTISFSSSFSKKFRCQCTGRGAHRSASRDDMHHCTSEQRPAEPPASSGRAARCVLCQLTSVVVVKRCCRVLMSRHRGTRITPLSAPST